MKLKYVQDMIRKQFLAILKDVKYLREVNIKILKDFLVESVEMMQTLLQRASEKVLLCLQQEFLKLFTEGKLKKMEIASAFERLVNFLLAESDFSRTQGMTLSHAIDAVEKEFKKIKSENIALRKNLQIQKTNKLFLEKKMKEALAEKNEKSELRICELQNLLETAQSSLIEHVSKCQQLQAKIDELSSVVATNNRTAVRSGNQPMVWFGSDDLWKCSTPCTICRELKETKQPVSTPQIQLAILAARLTTTIADNDGLVRCNAELAQTNLNLQTEIDKLRKQMSSHDSSINITSNATVTAKQSSVQHFCEHIPEQASTYQLQCNWDVEEMYDHKPKNSSEAHNHRFSPTSQPDERIKSEELYLLGEGVANSSISGVTMKDPKTKLEDARKYNESFREKNKKYYPEVERLEKHLEGRRKCFVKSISNDREEDVRNSLKITQTEENENRSVSSLENQKEQLVAAIADLTQDPEGHEGKLEASAVLLKKEKEKKSSLQTKQVQIFKTRKNVENKQDIHASNVTCHEYLEGESSFSCRKINQSLSKQQPNLHTEKSERINEWKRRFHEIEEQNRLLKNNEQELKDALTLANEHLMKAQSENETLKFRVSGLEDLMKTRNVISQTNREAEDENVKGKQSLTTFPNTVNFEKHRQLQEKVSELRKQYKKAIHDKELAEKFADAMKQKLSNLSEYERERRDNDVSSTSSSVCSNTTMFSNESDEMGSLRNKESIVPNNSRDESFELMIQRTVENFNQLNCDKLRRRKVGGGFRGRERLLALAFEVLFLLVSSHLHNFFKCLQHCGGVDELYELNRKFTEYFVGLNEKPQSLMVVSEGSSPSSAILHVADSLQAETSVTKTPVRSEVKAVQKQIVNKQGLIDTSGKVKVILVATDGSASCAQNSDISFPIICIEMDARVGFPVSQNVETTKAVKKSSQECIRNCHIIVSEPCRLEKTSKNGGVLRSKSLDSSISITNGKQCAKSAKLTSTGTYITSTSRTRLNCEEAVETAHSDYISQCVQMEIPTDFTLLGNLRYILTTCLQMQHTCQVEREGGAPINSDYMKQLEQKIKTFVGLLTETIERNTCVKSKILLFNLSHGLNSEQYTNWKSTQQFNSVANQNTTDLLVIAIEGSKDHSYEQLDSEALQSSVTKKIELISNFRAIDDNNSTDYSISKKIISELRSENIKLKEELEHANDKLECLNMELKNWANKLRIAENDLKQMKQHNCNLSQDLIRLQKVFSCGHLKCTKESIIKHNRMEHGTDEICDLKIAFEGMSHSKQQLHDQLYIAMEERRQLLTLRDHLSSQLMETSKRSKGFERKLLVASAARNRNTLKIIEMESEIKKLKTDLQVVSRNQEVEKVKVPYVTVDTGCPVTPVFSASRSTSENVPERSKSTSAAVSEDVKQQISKNSFSVLRSLEEGVSVESNEKFDVDIQKVC
ncbi:unnamed protein product [Thelazia callipaeda]|uniref:Centromere protein F n=1 Tax=Thelazia callipaeda TaxID=103827 RepID=A0A0N5CWS5_THECL|nr:unnamed protein product [Thelazia callipaeda]